jgi:translation initiation factor 3 subunit J
VSLTQSSIHYASFVEGLVREMVVSLSVDDTRKLSSSLTAMLSEKQKASKVSKKKSKKTTANVVTKGVDTTNYDDHYDDFDNFM